MFGWEDPGAAFTAVIQLGTMAAVLLYFRADLWRIASRGCARLRDRSRCAPTTTRGSAGTSSSARSRSPILGLAFKDQIENEVRDLELIGTTLIVFGLVMLPAEARRAGASATLREINARDGMVIGFAQALALVPGVSRSGATISAGLFLGFDRAAAARYSFLLSVPAVVLSGLFELRHAGEGDLPDRRDGDRDAARVRRRATPRSRSCCATSRATRSACSSPTASCSA